MPASSHRLPMIFARSRGIACGCPSRFWIGPAAVGQDTILPGSRWRALGLPVLATVPGNALYLASIHFPLSPTVSSSMNITPVPAGTGGMPNS